MDIETAERQKKVSRKLKAALILVVLVASLIGASKYIGDYYGYGNVPFWIHLSLLAVLGGGYGYFVDVFVKKK